jgi:hypothetical protein
MEKKYRRTICFVLTLVIHFLLLKVFELLANLTAIFLIFTGFVIIGFFLRYVKHQAIKDLGWGLLYGTLFSICLIIALFTYLTIPNFC